MGVVIGNRILAGGMRWFPGMGFGVSNPGCTGRLTPETQPSEGFGERDALASRYAIVGFDR